MFVCICYVLPDAGDTRYDVRGTMRGPGGEDHVGCLALKRLVEETDHLAEFIMTPRGGLGPPILMEIGKIHDEMKAIENSRGPGVFHGKGILPRSRRIIIGVISRLSMIDVCQSMQSVQSMLVEKFFSPVTAIATSREAAIAGDPERVYRICEAAFDLASFSSEIVSGLFAPSEEDEAGRVRIDCLHTLVETGISGYKRISTSSPPDNYCIQWGRLRGALLALMRKSAYPGLPPLAVEAVVKWNHVECEAIATQCHAGPASISSIFHESVISEDMVPAGAFVRVIGEILGDLSDHSKRLECSPERMLESFTYCILVLEKSMAAVLGAILLESPSPSTDCYIDPRHTLAEAWFLSLTQLIEFFERNGHTNTICEDVILLKIISESCAVGLLLLFFPSLTAGKGNNVSDAGMALDGPHTMALMDFLESSFALGQQMLEKVAGHLETRLGSPGVSLVGAALFRGCSGGLPPWAIEFLPRVYAALYSALGKDSFNFGRMLTVSMEVRLDAGAERFHGVRPGDLFAGRLFEKLTDRTKHEFIQRSLELCSKDTTDAWRRFKVIMKQLCVSKENSCKILRKGELPLSN